MEQRNGRIDRALQPAKVVRCHYFVYEHRPEDRVLATLVAKIGTIQKELGSLAAVVLDDVERALARGIDGGTLSVLDGVGADEVRVAVVTDELEQHRDRGKLKRDLDDNDKIRATSQKVIDFDPDLLRETLDVALELAGASGLAPADGAEGAWTLPDLPTAWQRTLDTIRPPRERDEELWDWRARPPLPVVFTPPDVMTEDVAHLHLSHPVTQRLLSRFLAQGFSARDLSRVTALHAEVARPAVLALGRLSLFGPGAARLHDELIAIGALVDWRSAPRSSRRVHSRRQPRPDDDLQPAQGSRLRARPPRGSLDDPTSAPTPRGARPRRARRLRLVRDPVPPFCPTTEAGRAAVSLFEDTVIDRLFALNAERAVAAAKATDVTVRPTARPKAVKATRTVRVPKTQTSMLDEE
jgi:hypothetical protein